MNCSKSYHDSHPDKWEEPSVGGTPASGHRESGLHAVNWDARDKPSGIYYYQLRVGNDVQTNKMMLLK